MRTAFCLSLVVACGSLVFAAGANWPQFRGVNGGVVADDPKLPETWDTTKNVAWQTSISGTGWGSPIVWGDHVFVTSVITAADAPMKARVFDAKEVGAVPTTAHRWTVFDVDAKTGKIRWQTQVASAVPTLQKHMKNSYASETPVTDGERIYVWLGNVGLYALDFKGKVVWSKPAEVHKMRSGWGYAASPVIYKGRLYVVNDNEEQSSLAAYDGKTGKELWRVARDEKSNWSTPYIWENAQRTEIVTVGSKRVRSYDLDGRVLWDLSGLTTLQIPTPFAANGLLFINSGFRVEQFKPVYAIRPGASGDITLPKGETSSTFVAWSNPTLGSYNPSSIVYQGIHYTLYDTSLLAANDARTGEEVYAKLRVSSDSTGFTASPWAYNGKIFLLSEDGDTFVIQAGREFKILGRNSLNEMTLASPAIADSSLFIRTATRLYRIGAR